MFRKIRSSRDPKDTLYLEIKNEFAPYFEKVEIAFRKMLQRNPRSVFWLMAVAIVISVLFSFPRHRQQRQMAVKKSVQVVSPVAAGFDRIMATAGQLRQTIALKKVIDSLSAKNSLSAGDSQALVKALDDFQKLNHQINQRR